MANRIILQVDKTAPTHKAFLRIEPPGGGKPIINSADDLLLIAASKVKNMLQRAITNYQEITAYLPFRTIHKLR